MKKQKDPTIKEIKKEQESRRCKNSKHPATHVNKNNKCPKAYGCNEKGMDGCLI